MCRPDKVLVYGNCAINRDQPHRRRACGDRDRLRHSAKAFGLEPRVPMLSYATGDSNQGASVTSSPSCRGEYLFWTEAADLSPFDCSFSLRKTIDRVELHVDQNLIQPPLLQYWNRGAEGTQYCLCLCKGRYAPTCSRWL